MHFRVGSGFDVEPVAGFGPDKFDQLAGVGEFAGRGVQHAVAAGQVATQGNHAADAVGLVFGQHRTQLVSVAADAGQVRGGIVAFGADFQHRVAGAGLGRAAGAERDGKKSRMQLRQFGAGDAQLLCAFRRFRWKQFQAIRVFRHYFLNNKADRPHEITL